MEKLNFRTLLANEIDCRISTVKENGISLLLYKDARVDQNILDEVVGPMNWSRSHQLIGDRLYCTVSIKDELTGEWISKQDVGTESYTEKEKGQASDSFKRACFNWGIGRELYTAPFIWITPQNCTIKNAGNKYTCYDSFYVSQIGYDENRNINSLVVCKEKDNKEVFTLGTRAAKQDKKKEKVETPPKEPEMRPGETKMPDMVTAPMIASVKSLVEKYSNRGLRMEKILAMYKIKKIEEMTLENYKDCMEKLKLYEKEETKDE